MPSLKSFKPIKKLSFIELLDNYFSQYYKVEKSKSLFGVDRVFSKDDKKISVKYSLQYEYNMHSEIVLKKKIIKIVNDETKPSLNPFNLIKADWIVIGIKFCNVAYAIPKKKLVSLVNNEWKNYPVRKVKQTISRDEYHLIEVIDIPQLTMARYSKIIRLKE